VRVVLHAEHVVLVDGDLTVDPVQQSAESALKSNASQES
jgi:hypothetical protein